MKFNSYSHRHGEELCQILHPKIHKEVKSILTNLDPFPHGKAKKQTAKDYVTSAFLQKGWEKEGKAEFSGGKQDYIDLCKWKVAIEMEWSRFEMFFRDFFRFMLLYERRQIDVGIILTYDEMAYQRWEGKALAYKSARASLDKVTDFLQGDYSTVVQVPIWCIGIE